MSKEPHLIKIVKWTCVLFRLRHGPPSQVSYCGRSLLLEVFPKIALCLAVVTEQSLSLACVSILIDIRGTEEVRDNSDRLSSEMVKDLTP
jgi:hypothetical protein